MVFNKGNVYLQLCFYNYWGKKCISVSNVCNNHAAGVFLYIYIYIFRTACEACGSFQAGVESELQLLAYATATAPPDLSHICDQNSQQCQILNPLSWARDWTLILMDTSRACLCWAIRGTPRGSLLPFCLGEKKKKRAAESIICCDHSAECISVEKDACWKG